MTQRYDAIVIGAGQAGVPLAAAFAQAGRRTAMIERSHVGGTCVNEGCTPTKTMLASARTSYVAGRAADYGVRVSGVSIDLAAVIARKRGIVESFRSGGERRLAKAGVELIRGAARFVDGRTLVVTAPDAPERTVGAPIIVINTGGRPSAPAIPGLASVRALDSTSIMELTERPDHLIVIGGGYVGVEFAQMFRRFGSAVTIVQRSARLLGREDPEVADQLAAVLREDGIDVRFDTKPVAVRAPRDGGGAVVLETTGGTIAGSHLLVATGRTPNTDDLNAAAVGVALTEAGFVRVNERLETTAPGIYAAGDVTGEPQFTHMSYDDYRILRRNLLEGGTATTTGRLVPYTVFTDPQLGRVGITETEARAAGRDIRVAVLPMTAVARAIETGETRGSMRVVVDAATKHILGAAVLGIDGGEIMGAIQIAIMGQVPYPVLRDGIFAHPTLMEALNNLFGAPGGLVE